MTPQRSPQLKDSLRARWNRYFQTDETAPQSDIDTHSARSNLLDFIRYTYNPESGDDDSEMGLPPLPDQEEHTEPLSLDFQVNWHHRKVCQKLDQVLSGQCKRLIITMPPGHGKSEIASRRFPAYALGKNPNLRFIATSYSADLASSFNRDVQRIIDSDIYREVFPDTALFGKNVRTMARGTSGATYLRNNEIFEIVGHRGYYKCAGRGGSITGRRGDIILVDDPLKGRAEAESVAVRKELWAWYKDDLRSRQAKNAAIIVIQTRWHENDLAGNLLREMREYPDSADQWETIDFPAELEELHPDDPRQVGEALWPEMYDLGYFAPIKLDAYTWASLYQQRPAPRGGGMIKSEWFGVYRAQPPRFERIIQSWDTAQKKGETPGNSHWCGLTIGELQGRYYLLDMILDRFDQPEGERAIASFWLKWQSNVLLIEDKSSGSGILQNLSVNGIEIGGQTYWPTLCPMKPDADKVTRMSVETPAIAAGRVLLPEYAPWLPDFNSCILNYPAVSIQDVADALSQSLKWLRSNIIATSEQVVTGGERVGHGLVSGY